ncbi:outer membrane beta-barrel protein [Massilia sp. CF038]|uniref:outer membrane beta-barrel protein n=1 Tax=Massilia sp. CF038 TaxID=1881045 RepID=UPI000932E96F|nr:outer membrane beta-barrel protein [Massilia sp. CF038]
MKKIILSTAVAFGSLNAAQAQTAPQANPMRFFVGMGLTAGGDKMSTVEYTDGTSADIRAGNLLAFVGGIDYQVTPDFSFQGSIGYHFDSADATNGSQRFSRFPVELLAYYHVAQQWRIGGGARYSTNARFSSSGAAEVGDTDLDSKVAGIVEAEYMPSAHWGVKLRYVKEEFKISRGTRSHVYKGDHVGVFGNYYF